MKSLGKEFLEGAGWGTQEAAPFSAPCQGLPLCPTPPSPHCPSSPSPWHRGRAFSQPPAFSASSTALPAPGVREQAAPTRTDAHAHTHPRTRTHTHGGHNRGAQGHGSRPQEHTTHYPRSSGPSRPLRLPVSWTSLHSRHCLKENGGPCPPGGPLEGPARIAPESPPTSWVSANQGGKGQSRKMAPRAPPLSWTGGGGASTS